MLNRPQIIGFVFLIFVLGCAKKEPPDISTLSQASQKFIELAKSEYNLDIVLTPIQNTLWVYLPLEEHFLDLKASEEGPQSSGEARESLVINFLDGRFEKGAISLRYDIGLTKSYAKSYGYKTAYTEQYRQKQQNLLTALYRSYGHLAVASKEAGGIPEFFVMAAADIINGLELQTLVHVQDLKRVFEDQSFHEEYSRRAISDYPMGHTAIIGDKEGRHLNVHAVSWPEFITRQMVYRIQYKYQQSSFPPSEDTQGEILAIAAETAGAYAFMDFHSVILHDLHTGTTATIPRAELNTYKANPPGGRLITIKFQ